MSLLVYSLPWFRCSSIGFQGSRLCRLLRVFEKASHAGHPRGQPFVYRSCIAPLATVGVALASHYVFKSGKTSSLSQCSERRAFVVDCGSGHSSAMLYEQRADNKAVECTTKHIDAFPVLVDALKPGGMGPKKWCDALTATLEKGVPVIIGATAGVRKALEDGIIGPEEIRQFHRVLEAVPDRKMEFRILTGQDEARAEHAALVACAKWAQVLPPDGSEVLLLSGGGKSMQLSWLGSKGMEYASIQSDSFKGTAHVKQKGVAAGLCDWRTEVTTNVREGLMGFDIGAGGKQLSGHFVVIEMMAWALQVALVPSGRWVSKEEVITHLQTHISKVVLELEPARLPIDDLQTCIVVAYACQVQQLLEHAFLPASMFYLPKSWEPMRPEFSLGIFFELDH